MNLEKSLSLTLSFNLVKSYFISDIKFGLLDFFIKKYPLIIERIYFFFFDKINHLLIDRLRN